MPAKHSRSLYDWEKVMLTSEQAEILWKQYSLQVDLYKFYLDLVVKVNIFYYAITGSILTYYFSQPTSTVVRYALVLPIVFSLALGLIFIYGAGLLKVVRRELFNIRDKLGLETAPEIMVLIAFLYTFGAIILAVGGALIVFIVCVAPDAAAV